MLIEQKHCEKSYRGIWKEAHGFLPPGWVVHHVDFDRSNNTINNLVALPDWLHDEKHAEMRHYGFRLTYEECMDLYREYRGYYETLTAELEAHLKRELELRAKFNSIHVSNAGFDGLCERLGHAVWVRNAKVAKARQKERKMRAGKTEKRFWRKPRKYIAP